jgi:hypothetical protein
LFGISLSFCSGAFPEVNYDQSFLSQYNDHQTMPHVGILIFYTYLPHPTATMMMKTTMTTMMTTMVVGGNGDGYSCVTTAMATTAAVVVVVATGNTTMK